MHYTMRYARFLTVLFSIFVFLSSCETEVDLFTEHGQTPVVFALLEPANPVQYFRINPTFIGDGDARIIAGNSAVTNYKAGELEVKLIDMKDLKEYTMKDSMGMIDLDMDGIFDVKNRIYYLESPVQVLSDGTILNEVLIPGNEYQLWIKHTTTGVITTSQIKLGNINNLRMVTPAIGISQFPRNWISFHTGTDYNPSYTFEFDADILSERFLLQARYYYTHDQEDIDSKDRFVTFDIGEVSEIEAFGATKRIAMDFNGQKFYSIMQNKLAPYGERAGQTFDLILTAVGADLDTYVAVQNATLTGLSQEVPSYTNIKNGIGIFSYRLSKTATEYKMNDHSAKELFNGPFTQDRFKCARHGTQNNSLGIVICR